MCRIYGRSPLTTLPLPKTLFITGATGFLGGYVARAALEAGCRVRALRRPGSEIPATLDQGVEWHEAPLSGVKPAWFEGCDVVLHCAAAGVSPQVASWEEMLTTNVIDSHALWRVAAQAGVRRFQLCGTALEYGSSANRFHRIPADAPLEPLTPYAASKAAASQVARAFAFECGASVLVFRPFVVFGEKQHPTNFWPALRRAAQSGENFPMSSGGQICDFIEAPAAALKILELMDEPVPKGNLACRNIGSGREQSLLNFASHWWTRWNAPGRLLVGALPYRPDQIMRLVPEL